MTSENALIISILRDLSAKQETDDLRRMKAAGMGFLAVAGIGGLSIGSMFMWGWDNALSVLRRLLA